MSGPKAPRLLQRILARIERRTVNTATDQILQRLAYLTVHHAGQGSPNPFQRACDQLHEVWGFVLDCDRPRLPETEEAKPTVTFVDGRNGIQWAESAIAYLRWRQGLDWRQLTQKREPIVEEYGRGIHLLTQLMHGRHDAAQLRAFVEVKPVESMQLVLHFPAQRPKTKRAAA